MSGEKKHASFGAKIKGAAHVVHGIGEDIRGSVMGAFESVSGSHEAKAKDEAIAAKGKAEIEAGVARMKGVTPPAAPESRVEEETKAGEQPKEQLGKEETAGPTPVPPPSPVQPRQAEPETSPQDPSVQQASQEAPVETRVPRKEGLIGEGADAPQGPGSSV